MAECNLHFYIYNMHLFQYLFKCFNINFGCVVNLKYDYFSISDDWAECQLGSEGSEKIQRMERLQTIEKDIANMRKKIKSYSNAVWQLLTITIMMKQY